MIDRSALDRIIAAGGFVSTPTGSAPEANSIAIVKELADQAMDDAACIGCGACVAACPNTSAQRYVGAKVFQLARLPQGQPERRAVHARWLLRRHSTSEHVRTSGRAEMRAQRASPWTSSPRSTARSCVPRGRGNDTNTEVVQSHRISQ